MSAPSNKKLELNKWKNLQCKIENMNECMYCIPQNKKHAPKPYAFTYFLKHIIYLYLKKENNR